MMMRYILFLIFLVFSNFTYADVAADCISIGKTEKGQSLTNKCERDVVVHWCHDSSNIKDKDGVCGRQDKFYQFNLMLKKGGVIDNWYSLPPSSTITYGACFGDYNDFKRLDNTGRYFCNPEPEKQNVMKATAKGNTVDEACNQVKQMATGKILGECDCKTYQKVSVCKLSYEGPANQSKEYIQYAKELLRKALECKPEEVNCIEGARKNVATGWRG